MTAHYRATHTDPLTTRLRDDGWHPHRCYGCGCEPDRICPQHTHIRDDEHTHPELIPS